MKMNRWLKIGLFTLLTMIVLLALLFLDAEVERYYHRKRFVKPRIIEKITDVAIPSYNVIDYTFRRTHGPHYYNTILEFEETPDSVFYRQVEKCGDGFINENDSIMTISFKKPYRFPTLFGFNGFWTEGDAFIEFREGAKTFEVNLLEWPNLKK